MKARIQKSVRPSVWLYQAEKGADQEEYRKAAVDAVKKLAADVGIPADLKEIAKPEDVRFLSESAIKDACTPGNPKDVTLEEIEALYRSLL